MLVISIRRTSARHQCHQQLTGYSLQAYSKTPPKRNTPVCLPHIHVYGTLAESKKVVLHCELSPLVCCHHFPLCNLLSVKPNGSHLKIQDIKCRFTVSVTAPSLGYIQKSQVYFHAGPMILLCLAATLPVVYWFSIIKDSKA